MKLKKELGIEAFNSPWHKAMLNILFSSQWLQNAIEELIRKHGMTWQQYQTLKSIERHVDEPATIGSVKEAMPDKQADTSRMISRLVEKGWVIKKSGKEDKRKSVLELTEKGRMVLSAMNESTTQMDALLYNLSKKECKQLNALLDKLRS